MALVKSDLLKSDWELDNWFENKVDGFICAVNVYHGIPVCFKESTAFCLEDEQGLFSPDDIINFVKGSFKYKKNAGMYTRIYNYDITEYEEYTLLVDGEDDLSGNIKHVGLTPEDVEDIHKRVNELQVFYEEVIDTFM